MIVKTLFRQEHRLEVGEVVVKLLPGLPNFHLVGLPDAAIRECGLKLKSALRSCGLAWPRGHQIVVSLRPSHFRKRSAGVDLAIALAYLGATNQLSAALREMIRTHVVYGELGLDGQVYAPRDISQALRSATAPVLTGQIGSNLVREGEWRELSSLRAKELKIRATRFSWERHWQPPEVADIQIHREAAEALWLASHLQLGVLVAGPQGSGKTTWAHALYALSAVPDPKELLELADLVGEEALQLRWRPFEKPHHTTTPQAMVGGGLPVQPGVISRAHGGVLLMDEFLEFPAMVLEALREPIENGAIEVARRGTRVRLPARFQLIATTNLCPCGRLRPERTFHDCPKRITQCRTVVHRLSGALLDRFDLLIYSHRWLEAGPRVSLHEVKDVVQRMAAFRIRRPKSQERVPDWIDAFPLSYRRRRSLLRVARGLADHGECEKVKPEHFARAFALVVEPMQELAQLFA
ncbi:MAG: ATP-binding protein [Bdellovibrionales bacterium]